MVNTYLPVNYQSFINDSLHSLDLVFNGTLISVEETQQGLERDSSVNYMLSTVCNSEAYILCLSSSFSIICNV